MFWIKIETIVKVCVEVDKQPKYAFIFRNMIKHRELYCKQHYVF